MVDSVVIIDIGNQKNRHTRKMIHHEIMKDKLHSPVQAVARHMHCMINDSRNKDQLLRDYIDRAGI